MQPAQAEPRFLQIENRHAHPGRFVIHIPVPPLVSREEAQPRRPYQLTASCVHGDKAHVAGAPPGPHILRHFGPVDHVSGEGGTALRGMEGLIQHLPKERLV